MIGGCGRLIDWGEFSSRPAWKWRAVEAAPAVRARPATWRGRSGASPRASRSASPSGGIGKPRPWLSSSFQAAPMPSQARPPDRTSSVVAALTQSAGLAVVDAADHEPERGRLVCAAMKPRVVQPSSIGSSAGPTPADLEEVVHDPERVEADVVGGLGDPGEGRADGGVAAGPRERGDLEADLHWATSGGQHGRAVERTAGARWWQRPQVSTATIRARSGVIGAHSSRHGCAVAGSRSARRNAGATVAGRLRSFA